MRVLRWRREYVTSEKQENQHILKSSFDTRSNSFQTETRNRDTAVTACHCDVPFTVQPDDIWPVNQSEVS